MDLINKLTYESNDGVRSYISTAIQAPEVSIFVKYSNALFGKNILDIGCGAGRTSFYLRNLTNHYVGLDYSSGMINHCKRTYPNLDFELGDARDLSRFSDQHFDFVLFSYNGIDYVTHEDRIEIITQIKRVLKKDGLLVFSTHNRSYQRIITAPTLNMSANPLKLPGKIRDYIRKKSNQHKLNRLQVYQQEYAIINDSGNQFGLLTYYISGRHQIKQLGDLGFETVEMFGCDGQALALGEDDVHNLWIYYVAKLKRA